jgi:hypothetical protein
MVQELRHLSYGILKLKGSTDVLDALDVSAISDEDQQKVSLQVEHVEEKAAETKK